MANQEDLAQILERLDGRGYKAYREIGGHFHFDGFDLYIDYVQGDPFASPSKLRARVAIQDSGLPESLYQSRVRRTALEDFLARQFSEAINESSVSTTGKRKRGTGNSNLISIDSGSQEVLERTAIKLTDEWVEARIELGLPAAGRRIRGLAAKELLTQKIPDLVDYCLFWSNLPQNEARRFVDCLENQESIRQQLKERGLIAFVANGSILPRSSGASDRPMASEECTLFQAPESLVVELDVPHAIAPTEGSDTLDARTDPKRYRIRGMGIPKGVTLIVGGGYHGKSTLLHAIERGVYPHIPGDGREYVVSSEDLVKIRAEEGRAIRRVDIHGFIDSLPTKKVRDDQAIEESTQIFQSADASGSTSQAASIIEAIESGASGFLLDEDTCASNFMLRDARMQQLINKHQEPITPFLDRVRALYEQFGLSTILVMGGSGDYFDVADTILMLENYRIHDVTEEAKRIAKNHPTGRTNESPKPFEWPIARIPVGDGLAASSGGRPFKIRVRTRDHLTYGDQELDLRGVSQIVDKSQTRALGLAIRYADRVLMGSRAGETRSLPLSDLLDRIDEIFLMDGLEALANPDHSATSDRHPGALARPRRHEMAAALNRLRSLKVESAIGEP